MGPGTAAVRTARLYSHEPAKYPTGHKRNNHCLSGAAAIHGRILQGRDASLDNAAGMPDCFKDWEGAVKSLAEARKGLLQDLAAG
jgi:hypothetical protein